MSCLKAFGWRCMAVCNTGFELCNEFVLQHECRGGANLNTGKTTTVNAILCNSQRILFPLLPALYCLNLMIFQPLLGDVGYMH